MPENVNPSAFARWLPDESNISVRSDSYFIAQTKKACWKCGELTHVYGFVLPEGHETLEPDDEDEEKYRWYRVMEQWLGCPVLYTIGWVDDGTEKGMFKFDDAFIADKLNNGHAGGTVNIHAWLTLPSMEVIDVALITSIAVLQKLPEGHGGVLAQHPDELKGMAYKPMLVGPDFLRKSGILKEWSIYTFG